MCTLTLFSAYICILHLFNAIFANVIININEMVIDKIKEICEKRNLTITELGRRVGLKKSSIYSVINNGNPTVETLEKIAKALDVKVKDFLKKTKRFSRVHIADNQSVTKIFSGSKTQE